MFGREARTRALRPAHVDEALALARRDPLTHALAGSRLQELMAHPAGLQREFTVTGPDAAPRGLLWNGANVSPMGGGPRELERFAEHLLRLGRQCGSLVGARPDIEMLWEQLSGRWGPARELRWSQPLLEFTAAPATPPASSVRPATRSEAAAVFPAAVAMFREEVGADPLARDGGRGYRRRVEELIAQGRTYVIIEQGSVVFKADVGAIFGDVAQIHGVWVDPQRRGHGIARAAMADMALQVQRDHAARVSLYVNDFNEPARRAYAAAGFTPAGELSTILF